MENFPTNRAETEAILRNALYIDAVIALKIDAESLAKRSYYHVLKSKNISELSNPEDTSKKSSSDESERDNALDDLNEK